MNYNYSLCDNNVKNIKDKMKNEIRFVVEHSEGHHIGYKWHIEYFKENSAIISDDSFTRTKKWLRENHPELLL